MQINTDPIRIFQEKTVPADSRLAGWSALVRALEVQAPVRRPCAVSNQYVRGSRKEEGDWIVFDKRYWPGEDFSAQLNFALRYEDLDSCVRRQRESRRAVLGTCTNSSRAKRSTFPSCRQPWQRSICWTRKSISPACLVFPGDTKFETTFLVRRAFPR